MKIQTTVVDGSITLGIMCEVCGKPCIWGRTIVVFNEQTGSAYAVHKGSCDSGQRELWTELNAQFFRMLALGTNAPVSDVDAVHDADGVFAVFALTIGIPRPETVGDGVPA